MATNVQGALNLAEFAISRNANYVHFSSDYVFDGKKPGPYFGGGRTASTECVWQVKSRRRRYRSINLQEPLYPENVVAFRFAWKEFCAHYAALFSRSFSGASRS